jgi:hypothetical protein
LPPEEATELLERRLSTQRAALENGQKLIARALDAGMPRLFAVEHEYELAILAAEVEFLTALLDDMRNGSFSGLAGWRRIHELRGTGLSHDEIWAIVIDEFKEDFAWIDHAHEFE